MEEYIHANVLEIPSSSFLRFAIHDSSRTACRVARAGCRRHFDHHCSATDSGVRAAALPARRVPVDARLLGLRAHGLLLDSRTMACASASRFSMDARLLGIRRRHLWLAWRLLGTARRILRRS